MSQLAGVPIASFLIGTFPLVLLLYFLGYFFYLRRIPKETGEAPRRNKWRDLGHLFLHLWPLAAIIVLILAFSTILGAGMPLMVLLMSFAYAAMNVSPTHVCLAIISQYFHVSLGSLVKRTIPIIAIYCLASVLYYLLLTAVL